MPKVSYKIAQKKYKDLLKTKFYPKGTAVPDTVDADGKVHQFLNGLKFNYGRAHTRTKPKRKIIRGTNHERMLARKALRDAKS